MCRAVFFASEKYAGEAHFKKKCLALDPWPGRKSGARVGDQAVRTAVGESAPPVRVLYQPHSEEKKET